MFEDDGKFVENDLKEDGDYGKITKTSYGAHVSTKYTSEVKDGTATLTAEKSTGNYTGYKKDKNTTFVVNVPAATHGTWLYTSAISVLSLYLIPAAVLAASNPFAAVTPPSIIFI